MKLRNFFLLAFLCISIMAFCLYFCSNLLRSTEGKEKMNMREKYTWTNIESVQLFVRKCKAGFAILKTAFSDQRLFSEVCYRIELPVRQRVYYANTDVYPRCPRCGHALDREFMDYCNCCGQKLNWDEYADNDEGCIVGTP